MNTKQETAVIEVPTNGNAVAATPAGLLEIAITQGADLDRLEKLMDMQLKWEANEARKAYHLAMSEFKKNAPEIAKDKHVSFKTSKGKMEYDHASLYNVTNTINKALADNGLSSGWKTEQGNGVVRVTCIITHKLGHSEQTFLEAAPDQSGMKNSIQAVSSTISYLERYTILALTGLATKDMDDDGRGSEPEKTITKEQEDKLINMLIEKNIPESQVFDRFGVKQFSELTVSSFNQSIRDLETI